MYRRHFLLSSLCLALNLPNIGRVHAESAGTVFNITWRDLNIGYSKINLTRRKNQLIFSAEVLINVDILGIRVFSYSLVNEEVWENKELQLLDSKVRIGNKKEFCKGSRTENGFVINGSSYTGTIKENLATTSYFTPDFLQRNIWVSTQNGKPLNVKSKYIGIKKISSSQGELSANAWEVTGDLNIELYYDKNKQWVGSKFKAGGSMALFSLHNSIGNLSTMWTKE